MSFLMILIAVEELLFALFMFTTRRGSLILFIYFQDHGIMSSTK